MLAGEREVANFWEFLEKTQYSMNTLYLVFDNYFNLVLKKASYSKNV